MNRWALSVVMVVATAGAAHAQSPAPQAPSIGLPLPPIGLPLPQIGLSPPAVNGVNQSNQPPAPVPSPPPLIYFGVAPYHWGVEAWQQSPVPGVIATPPTVVVEEKGRLQLEVTPRDAQIFVDGEFVGTWSDLGGAIELEPGTHRVELRAPKFETLTFDTRITSGLTITYRGALIAVQEREPRVRRAPSDPPAASAPSAPRSPAPSGTSAPPSSTFYLIPGCYLGNVPPEKVKLPDGCDHSRLITHTPKR
jgi:hypothetical protein